MVLRDATVACVDAEHGERVVAAVRALDDVAVDSVSDRTFLLHRGGRIEVRPKLRIATRDDLSMAYIPGVARVCNALHDDRDNAWTLMIKGSTVAVIADGTVVLGLGDIGPEAAMPLIEGYAILFKEFAGVDAFALCIDTKDVDAIAEFVKAAAPTFGGMHRGGANLTQRAARWRNARMPRDRRGTADEVLAGADVLIGVSGPETVTATGRSDYPNQINNVRVSPGIFRGALEVRAHTINEVEARPGPRDRIRHSRAWAARRLHRSQRVQSAGQRRGRGRGRGSRRDQWRREARPAGGTTGRGGAQRRSARLRE